MSPVEKRTGAVKAAQRTQKQAPATKVVLARKRVRVAKITLIVTAIAFLTLGALSLFFDYQKSLHPLDLLQEGNAGQQNANAYPGGDPLGIATEELCFERCTDDEFVLWYSTSGGIAHSQMLVDRALVSAGWIASSGDATPSSYVCYPEGSTSPLYALVLFYEQVEGCSIIIEVI